VATALAVLSLIGASYPGPVLARLCQRAENEFVGANCGIMDQFISANGKEDHALLLDCRDLSFKLAPIPDHVALVIANTMVKHSVAGGDYTTRRREVGSGVRGDCEPPAGRAVSARRDAGGPGEVGPRDGAQELSAPHVISENLRTVAAAEALLKGDLKELGRLMAEAHRSYSQDFEGSCVEADAMVALAQDLPGLIGRGRAGGCTINLVEQRGWTGGGDLAGHASHHQSGGAGLIERRISSAAPWPGEKIAIGRSRTATEPEGYQWRAGHFRADSLLNL
jgi:galactokinase